MIKILETILSISIFWTIGAILLIRALWSGLESRPELLIPSAMFFLCAIIKDHTNKKGSL